MGEMMDKLAANKKPAFTSSQLQVVSQPVSLNLLPPMLHKAAPACATGVILNLHGFFSFYDFTFLFYLFLVAYHSAKQAHMSLLHVEKYFTSHFTRRARIFFGQLEQIPVKDLNADDGLFYRSQLFLTLCRGQKPFGAFWRGPLGLRQKQLPNS